VAVSVRAAGTCWVRAPALGVSVREPTMRSWYSCDVMWWCLRPTRPHTALCLCSARLTKDFARQHRRAAELASGIAAIAGAHTCLASMCTLTLRHCCALHTVTTRAPAHRAVVASNSFRFNVRLCLVYWNGIAPPDSSTEQQQGQCAHVRACAFSYLHGALCVCAHGLPISAYDGCSQE
jgi:hypothetical protein